MWVGNVSIQRDAGTRFLCTVEKSIRFASIGRNCPRSSCAEKEIFSMKSLTSGHDLSFGVWSGGSVKPSAACTRIHSLTDLIAL